MLGPGAASAAEFEQSLGRVAVRVGLARAADRDRHRPAQLLRGPRDRPGGRAGEISLAIVLIIGFGLHNATEGFGIVAPLSGEPVRPSWRFLLLLGLIGGGPTFVGTLIGQAWVERGAVDPVPRARRRLDPLRRARARQREPADGLEARSSPGSSSSASSSGSPPSSSSKPPASNGLRT